MFAAVGERRGAAEHHVAYGRRRPQFAIGRGLFHASRKIDGDAGDVEVVADLDLACVHTRAYLDTEVAHLAAQRDTAPPPLRRHVEDRDQTVARALDHTAGMLVDDLASQAVVLVDE